MAYKHFILAKYMTREIVEFASNDRFSARFTSFFCSLYFQGVLRVRKRVTLSVITVSAIFGVCWITGLLIYILSYYDIYMFGAASYAISDTMFMFNSAINPFVYSLLNERFKGKLKGMLCYKCASRVQPSSEPYSVQLPNTSHVTNTAGACLD